MFFPVIMAGGSGERFWPASRESRPKQMLSLFGEKTLIEYTVERQLELCPPENIIVITSNLLKEEMQRLLPLPPENIIGEPCRRDTAPCVGLAAAIVKAKGGDDAVMAMLPADQVVHDIAGYSATMRNLIDTAEKEDALLTLGIQPTFPATGFGYIQRGDTVEGYHNIFNCLGFREKPDFETAREFISSDKFFWNAGIFVWSVKTIFAAMRKCAPEIATIAEELATAADSKDFDLNLNRLFPTMPRISVDYAILEKADNILVSPAVFDWDDAGSWPALRNHLEQDCQGNVCRNVNLAAVDSSDNIVFSEVDGHTFGLIGMNDVIAVHTADATLICPVDRAQEIKKVVQMLKEQGRDIV